MTAFDPRALRDAFGRFMTGVTVVTTCDAVGTSVGFTANSFASVSLDPPLVLVCPGRFLSSYTAFSACTHFGISILAEGQQEAASVFAGFKGDRFARIAHRFDEHGIPLIDGAIAQFSCRTHQIVPAGDHCILIGEVTGVAETDAPGLGYARGQFFSLGLERKAQDPAAKVNVCGAIVQFGDSVLLERTPQGYRPPEAAPSGRSSMRDSLSDELTGRGVTADLGPAFSVFDDPEQGTHFAYILAKATAFGPACTLDAVPIADLPNTRFASLAIARMMSRFAEEAQTRNFTLYLGNAREGETHMLTERA
jgi:flavin reductase (DIM6/NTAB) family NADH-FMN oxidoreductase RutF